MVPGFGSLEQVLINRFPFFYHAPVIMLLSYSQTLLPHRLPLLGLPQEPIQAERELVALVRLEEIAVVFWLH